MTLSDGQLVLSLLKLARGRLEKAVTQPATSGHGLFPKTGSSSLGLSLQASGILGSFYSPPTSISRYHWPFCGLVTLCLNTDSPSGRMASTKGWRIGLGVPTVCREYLLSAWAARGYLRANPAPPQQICSCRIPSASRGQFRPPG